MILVEFGKKNLKNLQFLDIYIAQNKILPINEKGEAEEKLLWVHGQTFPRVCPINIW